MPITLPPIDGMIVPGMGAATRTLLLQWPQLIEHVPEIQNCFQGTLNVHLSLPVLIINPERSVPPFEWEPNHTEGFGFVRIRFECPINAEPVPGWVNQPSTRSTVITCTALNNHDANTRSEEPSEHRRPISPM